MKIPSVKGTYDWLPNEAKLRDYLQNSILKTYQSYGFQRIMTPSLEDAENLDKSEGGENLNLIFRILKRGDKLTSALEAKEYNDLSDIGLRYDLTLPLTRYYANNHAKLILPLKCIQIDKVYRAERPQKGRLREFVQCDIDILGSSSPLSEVELINTTTIALLNLGMTEFKVKINDRGLLRNLLTSMGFLEEQIDSVCITFDKLDKIGSKGVQEELTEKEFDAAAIENLAKLLEEAPVSLERIKTICDSEIVDRVASIIEMARELSGGRYEVVYDMSLVRGQGYYTGTVFEIESTKFKGAIAGGGRYDNMIGKFLNESLPAVGFSIGFERIFGILKDNGYKIPDEKKRIALFYTDENFMSAMKTADSYREQYDVTMYERPKKFGKFLDKLQEQGLDGFVTEGDENGLKFF